MICVLMWDREIDDMWLPKYVNILFLLFIASMNEEYMKVTDCYKFLSVCACDHQISTSRVQSVDTFAVVKRAFYSSEPTWR